MAQTLILKTLKANPAKKMAGFAFRLFSYPLPFKFVFYRFQEFSSKNCFH
jgi:hypothetical protein